MAPPNISRHTHRPRDLARSQGILLNPSPGWVHSRSIPSRPRQGGPSCPKAWSSPRILTLFSPWGSWALLTSTLCVFLRKRRDSGHNSASLPSRVSFREAGSICGLHAEGSRAPLRAEASAEGQLALRPPLPAPTGLDTASRLCG